MDLAAAQGLRIGFLPTWGKYVTSSGFDGKVDGIFNVTNALAYGRFLGQVSDYLHDEPWLDFTSAQSSHGDLVESWRFIEKHWARQPIKPVMDLESSYPDALISAAWLPESPRAAHRSTQPSNDDHARRAAYWAVFAGAAGHPYGHNSIWQMYAPPRKPILSPRRTWKEALDAPRARQMGYLRGLIESRPRMLESRAWAAPQTTPREPTAVARTFLSRLQPAVVGGGFELPDYWIWCGAPIRGEDGKYHLFASRVPAARPPGNEPHPPQRFLLHRRNQRSGPSTQHRRTCRPATTRPRPQPLHGQRRSGRRTEVR